MRPRRERVGAALLLTCFLLLALVAFTPKARAQEGPVVSFSAEPCRLRERVANLPLRVTWSERGRVFEGCWGRDPKRSVVVAYFEDGEVRIWTLDEVKQAPGARPA